MCCFEAKEEGKFVAEDAREQMAFLVEDETSAASCTERRGTVMDVNDEKVHLPSLIVVFDPPAKSLLGDDPVTRQ